MFNRLPHKLINTCRKRCIIARVRLTGLRADERGTISIVSVFALLLLTMLLGMVINVGREVDDKIKLQNAADAGAYSGGVVIARGMNTLAFSNHLLCEVFAMTAILREGRDKHSDPLVPPILAAWTQIGPVFAKSSLPKFSDLGTAIPQKVPLEQKMVDAFSAWQAACSENILPVLEQILQQEMIPQFQRMVDTSTPKIAQAAINEIAKRYGQSNSQTDATRGDQQGLLWRTMVDPVGGELEQSRRTLPVVDPEEDQLPDQAARQSTARQQRNQLAQHYLNAWNHTLLTPFDDRWQGVAKMSQFGALWRGFTCGQLQKLLSENVDKNLPHLIRTEQQDITDTTQHLQQDFTFVGVVYRPQMKQSLPGLFKTPFAADAEAFAQVMLFIPRGRLIQNPPYSGHPITDPRHWLFITRQGVPQRWNLLNQNWTVQLVPATTDRLAEILATPPSTLQGGQPVKPPDTSNLTKNDLEEISTH